MRKVDHLPNEEGVPSTGKSASITFAGRRTRAAASGTITDPVCRSPCMRHSSTSTKISRNERIPATTCASAVPRGGDDDDNDNRAADTSASARSAAACGAS